MRIVFQSVYMKSNSSHMPLLLFCSDDLRYVEYITGRMSQPLPAIFFLLPKLCKEILRKFSIMNLRHSAEDKKSQVHHNPDLWKPNTRMNFIGDLSIQPGEVCRYPVNGQGPRMVEWISISLKRNGQLNC